MPNDHGTALTPVQQFNQQLDEQVNNFRALLPSHIPVEKFKRVVVVAISQNPDLFKADRRSLFTAAQKCAADGLLPDGRQAAFIVYGNKVEYQPMIAGIRQRMRNSGEVLSAEAHVVYRNDRFLQKFGDDQAIVHEPPPLGDDRGDIVGAYAIIRLKNGEILREVMDKPTIDRARAASKAPNSPAWTKWYDEMARKVVLRRCSKFAPTSADIDELLARDDERDETPMVDITPPDPEPPRGRDVAITHQAEPDPEPDMPYHVTDMDGEVYSFATVDEARDVLSRILDDAARRGPKRVEAVRIDNAELIAELGERIHPLAGNIQQPSNRKETAPALDTAHHQPAGDAAPRDLLGGKPAQSYRVRRDNDTSDAWAAWLTALLAMIDNPADPNDAILRDNREDLAIYEQIDEMEHNKIMRMLGVK